MTQPIDIITRAMKDIGAVNRGLPSGPNSSIMLKTRTGAFTRDSMESKNVR